MENDNNRQIDQIETTTPQQEPHVVIEKRGSNNLAILAISAGAVVGLYLVLAFVSGTWPFSEEKVTNFEECVAAGNPVMESFPRQCRTKDGRLFMEEVDGNQDSDTGMREVSRTSEAINYSGTLEVSGEFLLRNEGLAPETIFFFPDESSKAKFANLSTFTFKNFNDAARSLDVMPGISCSFRGQATIIIRDYTQLLIGGEVVDLTTLERVVRADRPIKDCWDRF